MSVSNEAIIEQLIKRQDLDHILMRALMERILSGAMPPAQVAASLALLRAKPESALEIAKCADLIIERATPIEKPVYPFADIVGTGGDGHNTINVSTLASITAASLGLPVAKHGNVSVSSKCGSADVLTEVGIDINASAKLSLACLERHNWCFLFAPNYHTAFKAVRPIRQELKVRTIFNMVGPLTNPLKPAIMLVGVFDRALIMPFAEALRNLGRKRALIVHGSGLDEIALHGPTFAALLDEHGIEEIMLTPKDLGLKAYDLDAIRGGDKQDNAKIFLEILAGRGHSAHISLVSASAGALLWLGEKANTLQEGVRDAELALRSGAVLKTLDAIKNCLKNEE